MLAVMSSKVLKQESNVSFKLVKVLPNLKNIAFIVNVSKILTINVDIVVSKMQQYKYFE
jgi:hypothetical protein